MTMWHEHYEEYGLVSEQPHPHVPNLADYNGLLDFMAVGNVLELGQILDRRSYSRVELHWHETAEMAISRWHFRKARKMFIEKYVTYDGEQRIHASSVFQRSLVEFAASLIVYKMAYAEEEGGVLGLKAEALEAKLTAYFELNYPELLECFHTLVKARARWLNWNGPKFTVKRRTREHDPAVGRPGPKFDFDDLVLYGTSASRKAPPSESRAVNTRGKGTSTSQKTMPSEIPAVNTKGKGTCSFSLIFWNLLDISFRSLVST